MEGQAVGKRRGGTSPDSSQPPERAERKRVYKGSNRQGHSQTPGAGANGKAANAWQGEPLKPQDRSLSGNTSPETHLGSPHRGESGFPHLTNQTHQKHHARSRPSGDLRPCQPGGYTDPPQQAGRGKVPAIKGLTAARKQVNSN